MEAKLKSAVQDSVHAGAKILRGEFRLAQGEAQRNFETVGKQTKRLGAAGVFGIVAGLFSLGFIYYGVATLLEGNLWLTGLVLAVVFGVIGAVLGVSAWKKMKRVDYGLGLTRQSLKQQSDLLPPWAQDAIHRIERKRQEKRNEAAMEKASDFERSLEPDQKIEVARAELREGRDHWTVAARQLETALRGWASNEDEVKKVIRNAAYFLPAAVFGGLGFWMMSRKSGRSVESSDVTGIRNTIDRSVPMVVDEQPKADVSIGRRSTRFNSSSEIGAGI